MKSEAGRQQLQHYQWSGWKKASAAGTRSSSTIINTIIRPKNLKKAKQPVHVWTGACVNASVLSEDTSGCNGPLSIWLILEIRVMERSCSGGCQSRISNWSTNWPNYRDVNHTVATQRAVCGKASWQLIKPHKDTTGLKKDTVLCYLTRLRKIPVKIRSKTKDDENV